MANVADLKNELSVSMKKADEASALMREVSTKLEEVQIRMGNALSGTDDKELQNMLNAWVAQARKDAKEITEILPSITSNIGNYVSRL